MSWESFEFRLEQYYKQDIEYIRSGGLNKRGFSHATAAGSLFFTSDELISRTIKNNDLDCLELILDHLDIPREQMNVKERLCYYQLIQEK